jgi:hypothetical protein
VGLLCLRPTSRETAHDDSGCPLDRNGSARWADVRVGVHSGVVVASFFDLSINKAFAQALADAQEGILVGSATARLKKAS